tara:strand:- start:241 stop:570 length:330 start_codon:yes stop_codon:yes gene_type:complete
MTIKTINISPIDLKQKLTNKENFILFDVREPEEFEVCHIDGSILVPLTEINEHLPDFDINFEYVVVCKKGDRSLEAIKIMQKQGFEHLVNLDGGIINWAKTVERTMELY